MQGDGQIAVLKSNHNFTKYLIVFLKSYFY